MTQSTPLTPAQLAQADLLAAEHYLAQARMALNRALAALPVEDIFDDDVSADNIITRSHTRAAARRVDSAQMHTRKAQEANHVQ